MKIQRDLFTLNQLNDRLPTAFMGTVLFFLTVEVAI